MLQALNRRHRDDEGFTLIELMVVVLIMGILMAIAIPTFLSTRGSAYDASAKSNVTNAFTGEKAYFEDNQVFQDEEKGGGSLDSSLPWCGTSTAACSAATSGKLTALAGSLSGSTLTINAGGTGNTVIVEDDAQSTNNCFYVVDIENTSATPATSLVGYAETSGGCVASTAITGSVLPTPTSAGMTGGSNAGANITGSLSAANWYTSW